MFFLEEKLVPVLVPQEDIFTERANSEGLRNTRMQSRAYKMAVGYNLYRICLGKSNDFEKLGYAAAPFGISLEIIQNSIVQVRFCLPSGL